MIVTDLDGTLLHTDETISEYSLNVLKRCREAGIKVIYATGRGERSAKSVAPCEYFDGKITQSGAVIAVGDDILSKFTIPCEKARSLLIAFDERGLKTMAEDNKQYYGSEATYGLVTNGWTNAVNYKVVDLLSYNIDAEKISVFVSDRDEIKFVEEALADDLHLIVGRDGHGIIMRREATKTEAIKRLAELWRIGRKEIASFGDDLIDSDMLAYSGIGIAVSNALEEVKAVADYICGTNDNDGVARWIEEFLL